MAEPTEHTAIQSLPYPDGDNAANTPADTPLFIQRLAEAVEKRLFGVYATASDRDTKIGGSLEEGMIAYLKDSDIMVLYTGAAWKQVYPVTGPTLRSGTTTPDNSLGVNGDVYVKF